MMNRLYVRVGKRENGIQGSYRNKKMKYKDFSRIIPGLFSVFKDPISLTFAQNKSHFISNTGIFIIVWINTGTTGQMNRSEYGVAPRSSTYLAIFTQFFFAHHIYPKESKRINVFYYFQGQFHIFKGNFTNFHDNSRTNGTVFKFQEFSRTKVKFKDPVRTLWMDV